jgi:Mg-chelatase subunit ChlD
MMTTVRRSWRHPKVRASNAYSATDSATRDNSFSLALDPGVDLAIKNLTVGGNTNIGNGVKRAIELVQKSLKNPAVLETYIVFVTDGEDRGYNPVEEIVKLNELGIKVFAFAVGAGSNCPPSLKKLASQTGAGECTRVSQPSDLERIIESVFVET